MVMSPNVATPMEGGGSLKSGVKLNYSQNHCYHSIFNWKFS